MTSTELIAVITAIGAVLHNVVRELRIGRDMRELRSMEEARFEQTARRDRRRRGDSSSPSMPVPKGEFDDNPTTDIREIRRSLSKRGERAPRPGTHHDKES